jgi:hypothetical protein
MYGMVYCTFPSFSYTVLTVKARLYILYKTVANFYGHVGLNLVTLLYSELLLSMSDKEFCHIVIK